MKNKEIKKIIKDASSKIIINDYQEEILRRVDYTPLEKETKKFNFKPVLSFSLLAAAFIVTLVTILPKITNPSTPNSPITLTQSKKSLSYEIQALGAFIPNDSNNSTNLKRLAKFKNSNENNYQEIASDIKDYLLTGEMMFEKDNVMTSLEKNNDTNYSNYEYKLTSTFIDGAQYKSSYIIYYNENITIEDDKKNETSSVLQGVMLKDNQEFEIVCNKEIEQDECELELKIFLNENKSDYIVIEQEIEKFENEYTYMVYKDNKKTEETSLEIETKNKKKEMSIELKKYDINGKELSIDEYEFEYIDDTTIECSYENDLVEYEVIITVSKYEYKFEFKSKSDEKRNLITIKK